MSKLAHTNSPISEVHARNLIDPKAYADGRIAETHAWLRTNNPVGRVEIEGYDPFWVVTRFDDIRTISRDNVGFHSGERPLVLIDQQSEAMIRALSGGKAYMMARSIVQMDPPEHMRYRLLTQSWFMPKNLKLLDPRIHAIAARSVEKLRGLAPVCDFTQDVALHYPLEVIMEILGIPAEDYPFMLRLTQQIFAPADPDAMPEGLDLSDPEFQAKAQAATTGALSEYFSKVSADRRTNPRDDLSSVIANAEIDGQRISDMDAMGYYITVATAGHDTTSNTTGAIMHGLATVPGLLERVKADLSLIPALVEEALRWASPAKHFMRSVTTDMEFQGRHFKAGDWVMICHASGNQDESRFPDPLSFNIDRPKGEHLAFGYGAHMCLGQHLGRQEMRILLEHLLPALKSVELAGEPEMMQSRFVTGFKHLPIRFEMELA